MVLVYVGSVGGMEERIVATESSLPFRALPAAALRGRGPLALARGATTMAAGLVAARSLIRELRPQVILGTGGYVCVPLFLAATLARVPTLIYLPDLVPGLAGRLLARIATKVAVNVAEALPVLGLRPDNPRALVVGYPLRPEFFEQEREACRRTFGFEAPLPVLLVYGGSRGARSINQAIAQLLPDLLARCQIIHVCGREGDETFLHKAAQSLPESLQVRYKLYPYLDGVTTPAMVAAFGAADLAICRSGASTLAELPAAGLPAILVPYPYVHQDENADYLVRYGVAEKVADCAMIGTGPPQEGALFRAVARLLDDQLARQRMAEQSRALSRPDAAHELAGAMFGLAARSGG
ncbi:UDP-N-acetylglucosamine--N-acetylmuramyl-(pentapeptide) pyrophosphoryl-undecaprenol N-acetylglucosamine transferase [Candidatus Viridilinea mediisalina]|uniref:UDP-N-acetylglucosamine--N-acetylmuramyl- (pentapeptide) pyrophosphoryl-undecaprenol N-acetylglucosamine transferase n=1 Tax=Candidatus Viridilinea mediisalina TaxID=2024553 RepID=UPI001FEA0ADC|nr:UDP-N-acetylglucosamine--N-acetylmuramyl-(pentapeptide) pyrophosphoryl-undecaprenol N-acetylglucosamine transferase [Candidatus Viridilinea mediisalina]